MTSMNPFPWLYLRHLSELCCVVQWDDYNSFPIWSTMILWKDVYRCTLSQDAAMHDHFVVQCDESIEHDPWLLKLCYSPDWCVSVGWLQFFPHMIDYDSMERHISLHAKPGCDDAWPLCLLRYNQGHFGTSILTLNCRSIVLVIPWCVICPSSIYPNAKLLTCCLVCCLVCSTRIQQTLQ